MVLYRIIKTYEDYRQYIKKIVSGQPNILTKDPIIYSTTSRSRRLIAKQMSFLTQGVLLHTIPECKKSAKGLVLMNIITKGINHPTENSPRDLRSKTDKVFAEKSASFSTPRRLNTSIYM